MNGPNNPFKKKELAKLSFKPSILITFFSLRKTIFHYLPACNSPLKNLNIMHLRTFSVITLFYKYIMSNREILYWLELIVRAAMPH